MVQICELKEEATPVRRMLYPRSSPAGQGIRWDWLGDRFSEWIEYDMDAQICIEAAWSSVRLQHLHFLSVMRPINNNES